MYGEVVVPQAVYRELVVNPDFPEEAEAVKNCEFIRCEQVKNSFAVKILETDMLLDKGESEALVLTEDLQAELLLVDERKARRVAAQLGLPFIGTLGVLLEAKRLGLVESLSPLLNALRSNNIHIGDSLTKEVLKRESEI